MSKQIKGQPPDNSDNLIPSSSTQKIRPLKRKFITFQSNYSYRNDFKPLIAKMLTKNPKWCNLSLKLGRPGEYLELWPLRRVKSLRLRSVHLESYQLDSSNDFIYRYFGQLDAFQRAGQTLKKLSLSVVHSHKKLQYTFWTNEVDKPETYHHLKKFVKKQKYLDEFGAYLGSQGNSKWMARLLAYVEKTVKTLTIENLIIDDIFNKYKFPKLETLRFEYIQFYSTESTFDFSIPAMSLGLILALPSLKALTFSQYQHRPFEFENTYEEDLLPRELDLEFWEEVRTELDQNKDKPLRIKYHKKDDDDILKKVNDFRRIFKGLHTSQTFEYEIARIHRLSEEEIKARGLGLENLDYKYQNFNHYWRGGRFYISLDKIEPIEN